LSSRISRAAAAAVVFGDAHGAMADVAAVVDKLGVKIQVNPRYGKWDPKALSLGSPTSNIPDFLKLDGISTPASATPSN